MSTDSVQDAIGDALLRELKRFARGEAGPFAYRTIVTASEARAILAALQCEPAPPSAPDAGEDAVDATE